VSRRCNLGFSSDLTEVCDLTLPMPASLIVTGTPSGVAPTHRSGSMGTGMSSKAKLKLRRTRREELERSDTNAGQTLERDLANGGGECTGPPRR